MNINKALCMLFALVGGCFISETINHLMSSSEGVLSSIFLSLGCLFLAHTFYKKSK